MWATLLQMEMEAHRVRQGHSVGAPGGAQPLQTEFEHETAFNNIT